MRLSVITTVASLFATLLNSECLAADSFQQAFLVNPLQSQIQSYFIQPSVIQTTNTDPGIEGNASFITAQKQLFSANKALVNQNLSNTGSATQQSQTAKDTQSILSELTVAFDAFNQSTGTNTVTTANLITREQKIIDTSNDFSNPSFTGDDRAIVFSQADTTTATGSSLFKQSLQTDHITPSGNSQLWLKDADIGVIYRQGNAITPPGSSQQTFVNEGLWWVPTKPGSGFDIGITSNNDLYMVWYTYTPQSTPIWYLASGPLNRGSLTASSWSADVIEYTWNGTTAIPNSVGNATLNFQDNTHASFSWTLNTGSGSEDIEYFVFGQDTRNSSGTWFETSRPGYGLTRGNQGSTQVYVLYFYDQAGNPRWALGSTTSSRALPAQSTKPVSSTSSGTHTTMDIYSGSCPTCPHKSSVATAAGTVTVSFSDELNGNLTTDISLPSPLSGSWQIFDAPISNLSE
ncbi:MAG: hypothetical protein V3V18_09865 [Methylococcales bacterium]